MSVKTSKYQLFTRLIESWKPRCKAINFKMQDLAKEAGIRPQHLSKLIAGKYVENPRIKTIDKIEEALIAEEEKARSNVKN